MQERETKMRNPTALLLVPLLALACCTRAELMPAVTRPNILLVMVDDMGWTDIGRFGSEIETPNIDALAKRGVTFSNFHVSVSCSPTRSMMLTGTDNHIAGLGNMGELLTPNQRGKPGYEGHLNDRVVTLAEVLQRGGYHTYMAGKWHLGREPGKYPGDLGFERDLSLLYGGASHYSDMTGLIEVETPVHYTKNGERLMQLPDDFYSSRSYADFLIASIREQHGDGEPFFAYLAFTSPHDPMHVPEPWRSQYRGRYDDGYEVLKESRSAAARDLGLVPPGAPAVARNPMIEPWASLSDEQRAIEARGMEVYAGMVTNLDHHLGRVVAFLDEIDELDNTIVLFFSDNGPNPWVTEDYPGNRGSPWMEQFDNSLESIGSRNSAYAYGMGFASASSGPLDRFKMTVSEGGIRSPMLIAGPGVAGARQVDSFSYVTDIMPTILQLCGMEHPDTFRGRQIAPPLGRSLVSVLAGTSEGVYTADDLIGGEMAGGKWMRQGDYKAVSVAPPYGTGEWHLYDLATDPGETHNLAAEEPEVLARLQNAWSSYADEVGVVPAEQRNP